METLNEKHKEVYNVKKCSKCGVIKETNDFNK